MSLETVLFARLTGHAGLHALVDDRIYRVRAPQGVVVPFIVHFRPDAERFPHMGGSGGVLNTRVQFDCFAKSDDAVRAVGRELILALDGWFDPGSAPEIFGTDIDNDQDAAFDDMAELYRVIIDIIVAHREV